MELTNFVFKPKNLEIAKMVIEAFANEFLGWADNGVYIAWCDRDMPQGYIKLCAESEGTATDYFSECCFSDEPVTSRHLTEHMMIALDDEGFFDAPWLTDGSQRDLESTDERAFGLETENPKWFSFEDVELSEVVAALSQNDSRIMSFYSDRVFITHKKKDGTWNSEGRPLVNHVLALCEGVAE